MVYLLCDSAGNSFDSLGYHARNFLEIVQHSANKRQDTVYLYRVNADGVKEFVEEFNPEEIR